MKIKCLWVARGEERECWRFQSDYVSFKWKDDGDDDGDDDDGDDDDGDDDDGTYDANLHNRCYMMIK